MVHVWIMLSRGVEEGAQPPLLKQGDPGGRWALREGRPMTHQKTQVFTRVLVPYEIIKRVPKAP